MRHMIIPDPHAHWKYDNERFSALGWLVMRERPDVVVCLGDWYDLPSLATFEKGTKNMECERYVRDVRAGLDAQAKFFAPIREYNAQRARSKEKQYKPRFVMTLGNHEDRLWRYVNEHPELAEDEDDDPRISFSDLRLEENGWEVYPFKEAVTIAGISYSHYFPTGVMGKPIGGINIGRQMCMKLHRSAVQGHSHLLNHHEEAAVTGNKIFGLAAGCCSHPHYREPWCWNVTHLWWRGVIILDELDGEGYYDHIHEITMRGFMRDWRRATGQET